MPEPVKFTRSAASIARERGLSFLIAIIVGSAFGYIGFFRPDAPIGLMILSGLAALIALFLVQRICSEVLLILKNGEPWMVEVTDTTLSWHSPVPKLMTSFELKTAVLQCVTHTQIRYTQGNRSPDNKFHLELSDGSDIELLPQECGINPHKVFQ